MKAVRLGVVMIVLFGIAYPLIMTGISQLLFPAKANGNLVYDDQNKAVGSELIGQSFTDSKYFQGRISSIEYDASASGTPNYAPSNQEMIKRTEQAAQRWLKQNPEKSLKDVPLDLITNSGSGLDPDISPEATRFQISMVSKATGISPQLLEQFIQKHTKRKMLGIFGESHVNVLALNMDVQKQLSE